MTNSFFLTEPSQIYLELPSQMEEWQPQPFSTASRHWNAYLNRLCLNAFLDWLHTDYPQAASWMNPVQYPSFWEFVDGSTILLEGRSSRSARLVLIPSAAMDLSELRVPQEWVDLPSWAGDYYLAAQVEPDEGFVCIWGFTTHERLKNRGYYDASDRTYCLNAEDLIQDLDVLWEARELCPDDPTRVALNPLPTLSTAQADNLIARLGNPNLLLPRLEVPFHLWGALLEHGGWRQRLCQQRVGLAAQGSVLQWLAGGVSTLAQQLGWRRDEFQPDLVGARGSEAESETPFLLSRSLTIASLSYELRIIPQDEQGQVWRFELRRVANDRTAANLQIPRGTKLRLLTEDLQPFESNEATASTAVEQLYLVVAVEPGEGLIWETEPSPDDYEREILRF